MSIVVCGLELQKNLQSIDICKEFEKYLFPVSAKGEREKSKSSSDD